MMQYSLGTEGVAMRASARNGECALLARENEGAFLVLAPVRAVAPMGYAAVRHEYNDLCREIAAGDVRAILFDMSACPPLEPVLLGMLVSLTHRVRDAEGDAAMCHLSEGTAEALDRLMQLEVPQKRAHWSLFSDRTSASAWLRTQAFDSSPH